MELVLMLGALGVSMAGAVTDLRSRRIPNTLTYTTALAGIVLRCVFQGWSGLLAALAGGLVAGGIFLAFYLLRTMGGGDIKLMTAIGCLVGPRKALEIVLATAIAGGVIAIAYALWQRKLRTVLVNITDLLRFHCSRGPAVHPNLNLSNPHAARLPYGVAIAVGVAYTALATIH